VDIFLRILRSGKKYWWHLSIGFFAMILAGTVTVWPSYALKLIIDMLASGKLFKGDIMLELVPKQLLDYGFKSIQVNIQPKLMVNWIPLVLLALFVIDGILRFFHQFFTRFFGVLVANELREEGHHKLVQLDLSSIAKRSSGDIVSCLTNDLNLLQSLLSDVLTALVSDSAKALALGVWLLLLDWKLSLIGAVVLPIFFLLVSKLSKKLRQLANKGQESTAELSSLISETVQGANLINLFNIQEARQKVFQEQSKHFVYLWQKQLKTDAAISPLLGILSAVGVGSVIWIGLHRIYTEQVTIGDLGSYLIATVLLYQPVKRLFRMNAQINQIVGTCERVFELIDQEPIIKNIPKDGWLTEINKTSAIQLDNLSFSYLETIPVLNKVNMTVKEGDQIAIVGSSGSGKSSLISLIPRLYEANSGSIKVYGVDVKDWDLTELRKTISFVPQDPFLFKGSIRENLLLVKPEATEEEIKVALEKAEVDFLHLLGNGIDSIVSERGSNLSGGQRQRISIARAFLKDSPILILDEPTSALDNQSEESIKKSILELMRNKTVLMVTHKLNIAKEFERVICMNKGEIIKETKQSEVKDIDIKNFDLV
jgi:subfamily B ATP-binding cassette protein MsbA